MWRERGALGRGALLGGEKEECSVWENGEGRRFGGRIRDIFRDRCEGWENDKELLHGAGWCSSCSDDLVMMAGCVLVCSTSG